MISAPHWKKSAFLCLKSKRVLPFLFAALFAFRVSGQHLAVYQDNLKHFYIFDNGNSIQAEYLPVTEYSVGGKCILYKDSRNHLKMYFNGQISTLEVNSVDHFEALDYLAVYSIGGIVKIIENGKVTTVATQAVRYLAEDSLVTFFDASRHLLAAYYKGNIYMLEDGLVGRPVNFFRASDNLVAYVSRSGDLKAFYHGQIRLVEEFSTSRNFRAGRDLVAYISPYDQKFKVFYKDTTYELEDFPPKAYIAGDDLVAYIDNTGSFKVFSDGETDEVFSFPPDFFQVRDNLVIYGEQGYFKTWYNRTPYLLETYTPADWKAEWSTIVYRDLNQHVKIFTKGDSRVLTYDPADSIYLYRDVVVVDKGMNNCNIYFRGRKY
jgi:hypothetical protein